MRTTSEGRLSADARSVALRPSRPWWPLWLIAIAVVCGYGNSFSGAFVFDDHIAIVGNPTLHSLGTALMPPRGTGLTVEGRPLLNLSLAVDYAISGLNAWSYHASNLIIHLLAALTLYGVIRRTLSLHSAGNVAGPGSFWRVALRRDAAPLALGATLIWALHPLQTESVTYLVQRTESLMGLLYLVTLYAFIRGTEEEGTRWYVGSALACAAGMATKEVMVTAPLVVLLYDRTYVTGSFVAALRQRRWYYGALAACWFPLLLLVIGAGDRGGTIGSSAGVEWWQFGLTQSRAVLHYASLAFWPTPLIFDYGADFVTWAQVWPYLLLDAAVIGAIVVGLKRKPALAFLGAWYFAILAPSSSVVGGTRQMLAEHRVYLSLAALAVLVVLAARICVGRRAWLAIGALVVALAALTVRRNYDYRSERALYVDAVTKRPGNVHARYNLGKLLGDAGAWSAAIEQDEAAVALAPNMAGAHYNLANALASVDRLPEAAAQYEAALRIDPRYAKAHYNLGNLFVQLGRKPDAAEHFRAAIAADPAFVEARDNLGGVLLDLGRLSEAKSEFLEVLRRQPNRVEPHCNLGTIYYLEGNLPAAAEQYERALALDPNFAPAREGLRRTRAAGGP